MKTLAAMRSAVHSAALLAVAPAPCWGRVAPACWRAVDAVGLRADPRRQRPAEAYSAAEIRKAARACAALAAVLRRCAADLAEACQRDCLLALAEDLDPL